MYHPPQTKNFHFFILLLTLPEKVKRLTLSVIFFLLFVKLRLKGQRTTICKYFYSLAIKIVFCLRFGQKSDTIIDDNS